MIICLDCGFKHIIKTYFSNRQHSSRSIYLQRRGFPRAYIFSGSSVLYKCKVLCLSRLYSSLSPLFFSLHPLSSSGFEELYSSICQRQYRSVCTPYPLGNGFRAEADSTDSLLGFIDWWLHICFFFLLRFIKNQLSHLFFFLFLSKLCFFQLLYHFSVCYPSFLFLFLCFIFK